jgi:hypothetical protein
MARDRDSETPVVASFDRRLAEAKSRQRLADREALAKGLLTREDLARKNSLTYGQTFKVDLKSAKRLW